MTRRSVRRVSILAASATVLGVAAATAPAAFAAPSGTVTLADSLPRWLSSAKPAAAAQAQGAAAKMTVRVLLAPKGGLANLKARVAAVSDPASAQYRHFISAKTYHATYDAPDATVAQVSAYLKGQGLSVDGVEAQHRFVTVSGSQAAIAKAFGTSLGTFVHNGETVVANTKPVSLPATIGAAVLNVSGLDTTSQLKKHNAQPDLTVPPPDGFRNARPCNVDYGTLTATKLPTFHGETLPYAPCGYTGPQMRSAYLGGAAGGTGVTVAITDAYALALIASDSNRYASDNGDGSYTAGQLTQNLPKSYNRKELCDPTGWSGEETLDVEAVHALAPLAKIRYYGSASCFDDDFQATLARVADEDIAKVVTNSWSDVEENESSASITAYEQVFLQGAMQGMSFFFSSGDNGDGLAHTGVKQVDYPASDPYVTAAGGTSTAINNGTLIGQTGWGTQTVALAPSGKYWTAPAYLYGAGGGFSYLFDRPAYQNKKVPATSPAGRAVPDISADADPNTGMLIGQTQAFPEGVHYDQYRIGGTSLASPLLAGITALAVEQSGGGLGWLNPALYSLKSGISDVYGNGIHDLGVVRVNYNNGVDASEGTTPFIRTFNHNSSLTTTGGWDDTTGLGAPNAGFITAFGSAKK